MKRINWKKHLTVDSVILWIASLTFVTSVFFLFFDGSFFDDGYGNAQQVGTFKTSHNDVRRRLETGMTWSNVDAPQKVFEGDSVFTGDQSEASIALENGTIIKIAAKSLVVIHTRDGRATLDLQYGSLQGTIGKKDGLLISQNGKVQELTGAGSEIHIMKTEKAKTLAVQVTKGQIQTAGETVKKDEIVNIDLATAKTKISKTEIVLLSPEDGANKWLALGAPLKFAWHSSSKDRLKVQFARNRSFDEPFYTAEVDGNSFAVSDSRVPEGTFFWRVKPEHGDASLPSLVTTYPDLPPSPVLPRNDQVYLLDTPKGEKTKTVFFTWDDKAGSADFEFELAADREFKKIVKTIHGKEKVLRYANLAAGSYFWHVTGLHPDRENAPASRLMAFTIREGHRAPEAPVLEAKELHYTIPQHVLSRFPASLVQSNQGLEPEGLTPLKWTPAENANSYEVEVALNPNFDNSIRAESESTAFTPKAVRPGPLYMRVRAKSEDGSLSPASETATLDVNIPAPRIAKVKPAAETFTTPADLNKASHEFHLAWAPQKFADSYELQWGSDPQFTKSKTFKVKETQRAMRVSKPMAYAARVRALNSKGEPISSYSDVTVASYKKDLALPVAKATPAPETAKARKPANDEKLAGLMMTLPIPQLKEPAASSALISIEDAPTFVSFKWKPFKNATYYTIEIAEDADFTKIVTRSKASNNAYVFQKALPEGKVFWRVRAHTLKGFSQWSDPSDINVIYQ